MVVEDFLAKNKRKQYTAHEIAEGIMKVETEFCARKMQKTGKTEKILLFQLMSEIAGQYPKLLAFNIGRTEFKPFKYFYKVRAKKFGRYVNRTPAKPAAKPAAKKAVAKATVKKAVAKKAVRKAAKK